MELRKILEIVWRRKWIIVQAFLIISLTTIIGTSLITPTFEASAKLLIKSSDTASSLLSSIGLEGSSDLSSLIGGADVDSETYIALAGSNPVLETVIWKLQMVGPGGNLMPASGLRMKSILSTIFPGPYVEISEVEDTDLLEIRASSTDPVEAAMIANTLAEVFIEDNLRRSTEEYRNAKVFIEERIQFAKTTYLNVLEEIKEFKIKEKTVNLPMETKVAVEKIAELMKEKEDNIIDLSEITAKIETLKAQFHRQGKLIVSSSAISGNPQIENLSKTLSDLELQLAGALTEKREEHPDVKSLKERIIRGKEQLRKQVGIFQKTSPDLELMERDLAALQAHLRGVDADIRKYVSILKTIPRKAFDQSQLELNLSVSQSLYTSLLEYLYQVGVAEAMTLSDITMVEPATEPIRPASPNKTLNGIMGAFLGLVFGFGLGFLIHYLDDTIRTPEEVKALELTFLGTIPRFRKKEAHIISERDPKDYVSESYRTIRNSIKFVTLDRPVNSLLIVSSLEKEGKSTTLVNLGVSLSLEGKEVLLLDVDLRKPKLHVVLGLPNSRGLTTVLAEEAKLAEAIQKTHVEGLSLLPSGPVPPDPGRMVESAKMRQLIEDLTQQYDFVLLDSPPILVANDSIVLAGYADATILVLESEKVTHRALSQARELFKGANIRLTGAILNKFRIRGGGHYYYKSNYYTGKGK